MPAIRRKALAVGIDRYDHVGKLSGCVKDAETVAATLRRHADGSVNFGVDTILGQDGEEEVGRAELKQAVAELFDEDWEIALFFFAGHGHVEATGGYLVTGDCKDPDAGLSLDEVMSLANKSRSRNVVVVLDCCHAGIAGGAALQRHVASLAEGVTILAASTANQYAIEQDGHGLFTGLLVDGLNGAAANLVGDVTPGAIYALVDEALGPSAQRPVFKTNVKSFVSLRRAKPPIALEDLHQITEMFGDPEDDFPLDMSYEEEDRGRERGDARYNPAHGKQFKILQRFNRLNLVVPVGASAPNMWHAAKEKKSCRLTALGKHYWRLVNEDVI